MTASERIREARRVRTHRTAVTEIRPAVHSRGECWLVEVIGFDGSATLYRRNFRDAIATARAWAAFLDAPRSVI